VTGDEVSWDLGDEDTVRLRPPVDPWPARDGDTQELSVRGRRQPYGYVYELILHGQSDSEHVYVGKCVGSAEAAITRRVHGRSRSAHTSPESIAKDPWKAGVLSGRAGWRKLETVYDCGDEAENDRALRRAEADWIRRLDPSENKVRPVRSNSRAPRRPIPRAAVVRRRLAIRRRIRLTFLLLFMAAYTWLAARVIAGMDFPWPQAPWIVSPATGVILGWSTFWYLHRAVRRILR
jgi:hypothetical protein